SLGRLLYLSASLPMELQERHTLTLGVLDHHNIGDIMAVLGVVEQSLRTGNALPEVLPNPLLRRCYEYRRDAKLDIMLRKEIIRDENHRKFCLAVNAYLKFLSALDDLVLVLKRTLGESHIISKESLEANINIKLNTIPNSPSTVALRWNAGQMIDRVLGSTPREGIASNSSRRHMLIWSTTWCGVFMLLIASVVTAVSPSTSQSSAAALAVLFLWQLASGVMSPLIWIVCTEAAPTRNREKVLSIALFVSFGVSLLIASISPYIQDPGFGNMGGRIGFIWGAFSVIAATWSFFMVPETKGKIVEQLDYLYDNQVPTRELGKYKFANEVGSQTSSDEKADGRTVVEMKA
ncbi:hypothetical protein V502_04806, partial [Pseudogymnoascus sp. VKM F-4520 (FW-2644)]